MCPHNLRVGVLQIQIDFELIRFGSFLDGKRHASAIKLTRGRFVGGVVWALCQDVAHIMFSFALGESEHSSIKNGYALLWSTQCAHKVAVKRFRASLNDELRFFGLK